MLSILLFSKYVLLFYSFLCPLLISLSLSSLSTLDICTSRYIYLPFNLFPSLRPFRFVSIEVFKLSTFSDLRCVFYNTNLFSFFRSSTLFSRSLSSSLVFFLASTSGFFIYPYFLFLTSDPSFIHGFCFFFTRSDLVMATYTPTDLSFTFLPLRSFCSYARASLCKSEWIKTILKHPFGR